MYKKPLKLLVILFLLFNTCSIGSLYSYAEENTQISKKTLDTNEIKNAVNLPDKSTMSFLDQERETSTKSYSNDKAITENKQSESAKDPLNGKPIIQLNSLEEDNKESKLVGGGQYFNNFYAEKIGSDEYRISGQISYPGAQLVLSRIEITPSGGCTLQQSPNNSATLSGASSTNSTLSNGTLVYDGFPKQPGSYVSIINLPGTFSANLKASIISNYDLTIKIYLATLPNNTGSYQEITLTNTFNNLLGVPSIPPTGDISLRNFRSELGGENPTDSDFLVRGDLVYDGIRKIDSISFETTSGCELSHDLSSNNGAYLGDNYTTNISSQSHLVSFNFGGNYPAAEFMGVLHAKITSDYYVTIRVTSEGKTYSSSYLNFFGNPSKKGVVQVKYVDEQGREVAPTETLTGNVGEKYETQAKEIPGYALKEKPSNATGTYTKETQTVTYVYKRQQGVVQVKYVDEQGREVAPTETLTGNVGEKYETQAKEIPGYTLKEKPSNATGTYKEETQTVTYVYKRQQGVVQVKYVDEQGREVAPTETLTGNVGEKYETQAKEIPGYTLKEKPSNATGTYTKETQTVTYVYKRQQGVVQVKYVDEQGREVAPTETLTGNVGEKYETQAKEIPGYALKEKPSNATGTYTKETQTVTYVYKRQQGVVQVKYVDEQGREVAPTETLTGNVGEKYETQAKEIPGYALKEKPSNATGTYTKETQTVTYVYKRQQGVVQVKYVDEQGREVAPTETLTGNVGEKYETQAKEIPGYTLKEKPSNATGTYTKETQTVTYVYKRQQGVVQVKYVDEQGREVAPTETLTGNVGEKYETQAKEIPGYALKEKPSNATGTYTKETQTVTYVYKRQQGVVQVKYVDEQGREVAPTETLTGNVGEKYETQAKEIPGYALKEKPSNATGTYKEETQTVTYVYKRQQGVVQVKYVDEQGREVAPTETLTGNVGEKYETQAKEIPGYALKEKPSNATGTYKEETQTVTYVYKKSTDGLDMAVGTFKNNIATIAFSNKTNHPVPLYLEINNNKKSLPTIISIESVGLDSDVEFEKSQTPVQTTIIPTKNGKVVEIEPNSFVFLHVKYDSKTLQNLPSENYTTKFSWKTSSGEELLSKELENYFGLKQPSKTGLVKVKYVDEQGQEIAPIETLTGNIGEKYETQAKEIPGYTLKKQPNNAIGVYEEATQIVTYVYQKIPDYYVTVPKSIDFTDSQMSSDVSVKILNKDGQNYTGNDSVQVNVTSANNFKLKETRTNASIPYNIAYQNNSLDNTNNLVGILSKSNVSINGVAKLSRRDESGKHYKYTDTLIYEIAPNS
ncbi:MucBP domain-containing protein [Enterococcus sp. AZ029]|uniref:MucBP domain-containing protein n=1 Tax=Enterococcus sp. AZ029 TaxID=2774841 RepID=UPI003F241710